MPFYLRKQPLEIPPPTEKEWIKKDEEEPLYLKDPDQIIDYLPQPFRMISKLVTVLFEQAWEIIEEREQRQVTKKQHPPPVRFQPSAEFQVVGRANCLAATREYIFIGLSTGLSVFGLATGEKLCAWETAKLEICTLRASDLGNNSHVLGTVDEMGFARLFYFSKDNLLHVKAINEVEDLSKRNACVDLELSHGGDYAGFLLQGSSETWLEIYRLPKDSWQKETEHVQTVLNSTPAFFKDRRLSPANIQKNVDFRSMDTLGESAEEQLLTRDCKMSPPALLMKVRSPKPLAGSAFKNPYEALMKSDDGTVVGLGQNHMIRDCHWERQEAVFNSVFRQYLVLENELESKEEKLSQAMFHFHGSGRTLPVGMESKTEPDTPVALSVHWNTSHNLCFYLLSRPPKEKVDSDLKPDVVWPCAAPIVLSAVTPCSSYLAFACEDGVITVWDKTIGFPLLVTMLPNGYVIRSIRFMPLPGHKTLSPRKVSPRAQVQLLVLCTDGSVHLITSEGKEFSTKLLVYKPEDPNQTTSAVATVPSLTNAVLTCSWDGTVSLTDTETEATVCHFITPSPWKVATPWQPIFAVDTDGRYLILQGDEQSGNIKIETGSHRSTIFLFDLMSCSFVKTSLQEDECSPDSLEHLPWDKRCDLFLKNSLQRLSVISQQIPECWSQLQKYAATLEGESQEN
ncbi:WD repeat-containing protein 93 [Eublepharis macularius]|uniref:WD repeat-containing protein 93 n=1 Tax=Eublepharis macularius TaxID=481883 RepID=A0AA97KPT2_EUBMA|nr:WD repeat-containing protein 93 [Eublepharis macularius]